MDDGGVFFIPARDFLSFSPFLDKHISSVPPVPPPPRPRQPHSPPDAWLLSLEDWHDTQQQAIEAPLPPMLQLAKGMSHVSSPPAPGSAETYDENVIISLMTQIYNLMIALSYLLPQEVTYPPADTGRHALNMPLLRELGMNDQVISLLEHLPCVRQEGALNVELWVWSAPCDYFHDVELRRSRDPHGRVGDSSVDQDGLPITRLGPAEVALMVPAYPDGNTWVLDTEANTIRNVGGCEPPTWSFDEYKRDVPGYVPENPEPSNPDYYRNEPAFHAPALLRRYIEAIRSLEFFPTNDGNNRGILPTIGDSSVPRYVITVKETLLTEYGWPDAIRADDWARDYERVWKEAESAAESRDGPDGASGHAEL